MPQLESVTTLVEKIHLQTAKCIAVCKAIQSCLQSGQRMSTFSVYFLCLLWTENEVISFSIHKSMPIDNPLGVGLSHLEFLDFRFMFFS